MFRSVNACFNAYNFIFAVVHLELMKKDNEKAKYSSDANLKPDIKFEVVLCTRNSFLCAGYLWFKMQGKLTNKKLTHDVI